jgi:hypothetical protein
MGECLYRSTFFGLGTIWRWVVSFTPRQLYSRYPLDRRLGGPQSRLDEMEKRKILPLPGLDLRLQSPPKMTVRNRRAYKCTGSSVLCVRNRRAYKCTGSSVLCVRKSRAYKCTGNSVLWQGYRILWPAVHNGLGLSVWLTLQLRVQGIDAAAQVRALPSES